MKLTFKDRGRGSLDGRLEQLLVGQRELIASANRIEGELRAEIAALRGELDEERQRGRELTDQMHHLIDELAASRKLWHACREKAEAFDRLQADSNA